MGKLQYFNTFGKPRQIYFAASHVRPVLAESRFHAQNVDSPPVNDEDGLSPELVQSWLVDLRTSKPSRLCLKGII